MCTREAEASRKDASKTRAIAAEFAMVVHDLIHGVMSGFQQA